MTMLFSGYIRFIFYFRYDIDGKPVECCLVDWQVIRVASPAIDLNYMLYCSIDGDVRSKEMSSFFAIYYSTFASIMVLGKKSPRFTLDEFENEFYSKNFFGLMTAMMLVPIVLRNVDESPALEKLEGEDLMEVMRDFQGKLLDTLHTNPFLKPRLLSVFDEMKEHGLFDEE